MRPSIALDGKREIVRATVCRYRTANPRVFGSVLKDEDTEGSDLDLLVDALPGTALFDLGGLQVELEDLLGVAVEALTPGNLSHKFRAMAEARPI